MATYAKRQEKKKAAGELTNILSGDYSPRERMIATIHAGVEQEKEYANSKFPIMCGKALDSLLEVNEPEQTTLM